MGKMFKIPEWEDTPDINISFPKKVKEKKKTTKNEKKAEVEYPKPNGVVKPKFKSKNLNKKVNKSKKYIQKQNTANISNKKSVINEVEHSKKEEILYDTEKFDELAINEKKQKLDTFKGDDIEEMLFNENSEIQTHGNIQPEDKIIQKHKSSKKVTPLENVTLVKVKTKKNKKKSKQAIPQKGKSDNNTESKNKITKIANQSQINIQELTNKVEKTKKSTVKNDSNNGEDKTKKLNQIQKTIAMKINQKKKDMIKSMIDNKSHRNCISVSSNKLRGRMMERLRAAQFRYLNEKLYTSSGSEARQLFQEDPGAFQVYHEGYQQQVKRWPVKPLDVIVKRIQRMPKTHTIADMGCGEAELSTRVVQTVRSFDLVSSEPRVEPCDMAHTPLLSASTDVAVYCLALMGTDLTQYLIEANRILKVGGHLLIAEVESRFHDVDSFTSDVQKLGFSVKTVDKSHEVFLFMEFTKQRDPPTKKGKLPELTLKPCIYKKR